MTICILDGLTCTHECNPCRVQQIKEDHCILDGLPCDNCKRCEEIQGGKI